MAEVKVGDRIKLSCRQDVEGISEYDGKIFKVEELNDEDCVLSHEDYDLPIVIPYMYCTFRKVIDDNQSAKADTGKLGLTLVPRKIIFEIAKIREYGCKKYKDPDNWKRVEVERYRDAAYRHFMAYLDNPNGVDEESGLPHLSHLACNIAFLCEMEQIGDKE